MALFLPTRRPEIGSIRASLFTSAYLLLVTNLSFWTRAAKDFGGGQAFWIFVAALSALFTAVLIALSFKYVIKPVFIFLILVAATSAYFTDTFGTIVNMDMIENAATTTSAEAGHLLTPEFFLHLALFGFLPSLLIVWVRILHRPLASKLVVNLASVAGLVLVGGGLAFSQIGNILVTLRTDHPLMEMFNPSGPISATVNYALSVVDERTLVRQELGKDAKLGPLISAFPKPVVTILVVGETARAMNFSLNGYGRETNPELKKLDIVNYPHATSCGTDTAYSLPCMFSIFPRSEFSKRKAKGSETLMDVIRHAGIDAYWWDNNTGSKGIADLINFSSLTGDRDPQHCVSGECRDGIFLKRLEEIVGAARKDTVIVLHQIGSHGPAYYTRYPEEFRVFKPDCRNPQLTQCKIEEVVNAYDNSILYTDHFLAQVIGTLTRHEGKIAGAMLYMSDHGESLGENGLFLHGAPYAIAPPEQTRVPLIAWFSPEYRSFTGLDQACLSASTASDYSHDNYFHTVLGMMDVKTAVYNPGLDMFKHCRTQD